MTKEGAREAANLCPAAAPAEATTTHATSMASKAKRSRSGPFTWTMTSSVLLLATLLGLLQRYPVQALVSCFSIFDCEARAGKGSVCSDGFCTNPYFEYGCLPRHQRRGNDDVFNSDNPQRTNRVRTCSSEDPPEAVEQGFCRPSLMDYAEIRIASQNWESVFFEAWILQIVLSEVLNVPVTIETGTVTANVDFYDRTMRFQYGTGNDWEAIRTARELGDCRLANANSNDTYRPCYHVVPEVWTGGQSAFLSELEREEIIERPAGLGALGSQSWFVPKFTAERDSSLLSYIGMQGPENRKKLALAFLRPTTWQEYCDDVSLTDCAEPDDVATQPPGDGQGGLYFHGLDTFKGFFRNTTENDCTDNPNCTGHIVDYPCGWSSYVSQQAHHLDIAVESNGKQPGSNGYAYGEMVQIWNAANATRSNVLLQWWSPEALFQEFLGTSAEFTRVSLPPPSQECVEHRVSAVDRCSDDPEIRIGDPRGACHEAPQVLAKVVSTALREISMDPNVDAALYSPAYDLIKDFRITDLELGEIFDYWLTKNLDRWNLDPRDAVCQWVVENLEQLETFIPRSYPRAIEDEEDMYTAPALYAAITVTCLAITLTLLSILTTYLMREKPSIRIQQVEFLLLLLFGILLVSLGALLNVLLPTDALCVSVIWLVNLGYTLELVPLIVKVNAVNRLMAAARQMRRLELRLGVLYGAVLFVFVLVGSGLAVWTAVDPPHKFFELFVTEDLNSRGETIVSRTYYCSSDREFWDYLSVTWQLLLLIAASVLAFQTRNITQDINETRTLAMLIYSHFVFVILRTITYVMDSSVKDASDIVIARTFIYSADSIATICIYFLPKFFRRGRDWSKQGAGNFAPHQQQNNRQNHTLTHQQGSHSRASGQPIVSAHRARDSFQMEIVNSSEGDSETGKKNINAFGRPLSLRDSSRDYKLDAQWENSNDDKDSSFLDKVLEEGEHEEELEADESSYS